MNNKHSRGAASSRQNAPFEKEQRAQFPKIRKSTAKVQNTFSKSNIEPDSKIIKDQLKQSGQWNDFQQIMKPNTYMSIFYMLRSVAFICICTGMIHFAPEEWKALVVIASTPLYSRSLRSLGNQVHDLSHGNVFQNKKWNRWLNKYLLCPLMFYSYDNYIESHIRGHHPWLSIDGADPDYIAVHHSPIGNKNVFIGLVKLLSKDLLSFNVWLSSTFGDLFNEKIKPRDKLFILVFWLLNMSLLSLFTSFSITVSFISIWIFMRGTIYHIHKVFVEYVDHYNLPTDSVLQNSRIIERGLIAFFIHPDNDNYHAPHHLYPKIPLPNMHRAHKVLLGIEYYAKGNIYKTYRAVTKSLLV